ncbi:MAG: toprim domain-containing protein [Candidatus Thorarchaeota archaeon]
MSRDNNRTLRDKVEIFRTRSQARESTRRLRDNETTLINLIQKVDGLDDVLVIVEGKRDEQILRKLGLAAQIIKTQQGLPRPELLDDIASQAGRNGQVLILTDFDQKGIEICRYIEKGLEPRRVKVLKRYRREIRKAMGNWRCIEELVALFKRRDSPEPIA